jgi:3-oxoacyl-[acyl-carrier-protein] synthase-3
MYQSTILGTGHHVPPRVVTNFDLEKMMDTTDAWIRERTGIIERHYVDEGMTGVDLAYEASINALKAADLPPENLDMIILGTLSPDHEFPGNACFLQARLGVPGIPALDIRTQCTGFLYGLSVADQFIKTGMYQHILVIGSEIHSTGLDLSTAGREVSVLFGDGAGAVVLGRTSEEGYGIRSTHLFADGQYAKELWTESPGSCFHPRILQEHIRDGRIYPSMNGQKVFKFACRLMPKAVEVALEHNHLTADDVSLFIFHQANLRISEMVRRMMKLPEEKTFNNIQKYGNTTAASIPIALDECVRSGMVKKGDVIILSAFGAGFTWASALVKWTQ